MISRLSIAWRLILFFLVGAGLVMGAVIGFGYYRARVILELEQEASAQNLAWSTAYRIGTVTKSVEQAVHGLAAALEAGCPATEDGVWRLLEKTVMGTGEIYGSCYARSPDKRSTGTRTCAPYVFRKRGELGYEDLAAQDGYAYHMQDWFTLPCELGRLVWSEPYFDEGGGNTLMVTCSAPVRANGGNGPIEGVVTCDVSLSWLTGVLADLSVGRAGFAFLISHNGTYIAHPSPELIVSENVFSQAEALGDHRLRELGRRMVRGEAGYVAYSSLYTREPSWLVFAPVPSSGWTVAVVIPQRVLMEKVSQLSRFESHIATGGFALLFLIVLLISRTITRPIEQLDAAAKTLAAGNLDAALPRIRGRDEIAELGASFATMRDELKMYIGRLAETVAAKERIQSELRIAHDIQMGLVPKTFPPFPSRRDVDLYAVMNPAREVGGDFYDFFLIDEQRLCIVIADVSGKGVPAALFMAVTRSILRSVLREEDDPAKAIERVNSEVAADNPACMFVTLFCAVIDLKTGDCVFANGGHNRPMIVRPDGTATMVPKTRGTPIGAFEQSRYDRATFALVPGEMLFLYTDGVTEAMNPALELFGEERMSEVLQASCHASCTEMLQRVESAVHEFAAGAEQSDDLTMLAIRLIPYSDVPV